MSYTKSFFFTKKRNMFLGVFFFGGGDLAETMCFTRFLQDFESNKKTIFGARVGSILDSPEPKTLYFIMFFNDFTRFVFEAQE